MTMLQIFELQSTNRLNTLLDVGVSEVRGSDYLGCYIRRQMRPCENGCSSCSHGTLHILCCCLCRSQRTELRHMFAIAIYNYALLFSIRLQGVAFWYHPHVLEESYTS